MSYDSDPYPDDLGGFPSGGARQSGSRAQRPQNRSSGSSGGDHTKAAIESGKYTEVKNRIQEFYAKYPTGALVTTKVKLFPIDEIDGAARIMVKAKAYRVPDDPHPGTGTSWMVVPGKTPYTNGSEVENCETSAWGRAIAAVGILIDKGIASASEIRNARGEDGEPGDTSQTGAAQLAAAAAEAAGATETTAPPPSGTEAPPEPEQPSPVKEEASPVIAAAQAAADEGAGPEGVLTAAMEAAQVTDPPDEPIKPKRAAKSKGPVADPEAQAAPADPAAEQGLSYDDFVRLAREKFMPNGHIANVARELVEAKAIPQVGGVRELTDQQRLTLFYACIARMDDTAEGSQNA